MQSPPIISTLNALVIPTVQQVNVSNGVEILYLDHPSAKYIQFEIVFQAGRLQEQVKLTSKSLAGILKEGTENRTSEEIAEFIDVRGASLRIRNTLDHIIVTGLCLSGFAEEFAVLLSEICLQPALKQTEFDKYQKRHNQKLNISLTKTDVVAYREMTAQLYGENAAYGYNSSKELLEKVELETIKNFHKEHFLNGPVQIFCAGSVNSTVLKTLEREFQVVQGAKENGSFAIESGTYEGNKVRLDIPNSVQTAIRIARISEDRSAKDFPKLFFLNLAFGGFFGSRLMRNIREEKGLTYGIYSANDTLKHSAYFYVSTETRHENVETVVKAIYDEMSLMGKKGIEGSEMKMMKNYLNGQFLRMVDGPLNVMKLYRTLAADGIEMTFFHQLFDHIKGISPDDIQSKAQDFLNPERFVLLTVGQA